MSSNPADSSISTGIALVVFCRRPLPGIGKRRIARELGDARTVELAGHLLATTLEDAGSWPGPVIIAPACADDEHWAEGLLPDALVLPQLAGNLGERINAVDAAARALGHTRLVYIGSDAPVLTPDYFARARAALAEADVVLGPADDGGVTLMGAACAWPDLVTLPWSSAGLGERLQRACTDHGLSVACLERRYDIDMATDLTRLHADLADDSRPARRALLRWVRTNVERPAAIERAAG